MSIRTVDFSSTAYAKTKSFTAKENISGAARVKEKRKDPANQAVVKSSWTPTKAGLNEKLFEERRDLVSNWFDRWTDAQRREILQMLVGKCRHSQLQYAFSLVDDKIPITHVDFTRRLPRVVSIYIFSFLDPRSLCRCAQVCWYWKFLSELDQIWLPKCLKFGWLLSFVPSPFEHGVWKRHYLESVRGLQYIRPKSPTGSAKMSRSGESLGRSQSLGNLLKKTKQTTAKDQPVPWRGPDPRPVDTAWKFSSKDSPAGGCKRCNRSSHKDDTDPHTHDDHGPRKGPTKNTKPRIKAATYAQVSTPESKEPGNKFDMRTGRPDWAVQSAIVPVGASRPPGPAVRPSAQALGNSRSNRDLPTAELFPSQPWRRRTDYDSD